MIEAARQKTCSYEQVIVHAPPIITGLVPINNSRTSNHLVQLPFIDFVSLMSRITDNPDDFSMPFIQAVITACKRRIETLRGSKYWARCFEDYRNQLTIELANPLLSFKERIDLKQELHWLGQRNYVAAAKHYADVMIRLQLKLQSLYLSLTLRESFEDYQFAKIETREPKTPSWEETNRKWMEDRRVEREWQLRRKHEPKITLETVRYILSRKDQGNEEE